MKFEIAHTWEVNWDVGNGAYDGKLSTRPYTHYFRNKRLDLSRNLWCLSKLLEVIQGDYNTIVEYFCGVGTDYPLLSYWLNPNYHVALDLDEGCIELYNSAFPGMHAEVGDFYMCAGIPADVSVLDIETYTILKLTAKEFNALRKVFASTSQWVILVDTAIGKFHLNWEAYQKELYTPIITMDDYFQAVSRYYRDNFGWVITHTCSHTRASYTLMRKMDKSVPKICNYKATPEADDWFVERSE